MQHDLFGNPIGLSYKSPFGYPGGKHYAMRAIAKYIPKSDVLLSPFLGSGKLELALNRRGTRIFGYDSFEPLVNCLHHLQKDYKNLYIDAYHFVESHLDNLDVFRNLRRDYQKIKCNRERALAYFILNHITFAGNTFRGSILNVYLSDLGIALGKSQKIKLRKPDLHFKLRPEMFFNPLFEVGCLDFRESLEKHSDVIVYLDPPYPVSRGFYGDSEEYHESFPHQDLAKILYDRKTFWVLSYNDTDIVQDLYPKNDFRYVYPDFRWSLRKDNINNEVLIMPKEINGVF